MNGTVHNGAVSKLYLIQSQRLSLSPDDPSLPKSVDDGIIHNCIWFAALLAHKLICSEGSPPLPSLLISTDEGCECDHVRYAALLLHLLKQLCCSVTLCTCIPVTAQQVGVRDGRDGGRLESALNPDNVPTPPQMSLTSKDTESFKADHLEHSRQCGNVAYNVYV